MCDMMEELIVPASNNGGEVHVDLSGTGLDEAVSSAIFGDRVLLGDSTFIDSTNPSSSIILKVIDQDGSYYLDPSQFSDINLDDCGDLLNSRNNASFNFIQLPFQQHQNENHISKGPTIATTLLAPQTSITTSLPISEGTTRSAGGLQQQAKVKDTEPPRDLISDGTSKLVLPPKAAENSSKSKPATARMRPSKSNISKAPRQKKTAPEVSVKPQMNINDGPFHCSICKKDFLKWPSFRRHKAEHLDEKSFRCDQCPSSFNYESNLKLHGMLHEAEKSGCLQCQVCSTKLSRLASLRSHLRIHEKEENLVCTECGDEFPTKGRLEAHLDVHRTRTQQCMLHRCSLCGKSFNQAALLKDHTKEHTAVRKELKILNARKRKSKPNPPPAPPIDTNSSQTPSRPEVKKVRACHVCGKGFEKPSQLQRHIRVHTGEKPFECKNCGRRFNQKGTLDSHILATHEKMKPHICQLCSCKFSQRGNLKAHMLKVHVTPAENENAFKCLECTCVYRRLATLNNHIAKVHAVHSYPRGLISVSKNAPKLVPTDPHKSIVVTIPNTMTYNLPKPKAAAVQHGPVHSEVNKTSPLAPNQSANMIILGSGDSHTKEQLRSQPKDKVDSQISQGPISEVNLVHNEQGKAGSCRVKIKKVGETKYHLCSSCSKAFRKPSDLIRHMRVHTQEKPYICYVCNKAFAVNSTLKQHLRTHMGIKELECQTCQRKFSMISSLRAHERLHTGAKPFPCVHCGKCFRTSGQRRIHTRVHTRNALGLTGRRKLLRIGENQHHVDLPDPLKITEDGLAVPVLNRSVHTLGTVGSVDGKPRKYKCKMCPKSFKKSSHLKQHIRSHTGERPYQCYQCQRSFVSSGVLKNHIKTHEGVRAYQCSTCKLSFTTNGSLTRHMATHSNARNFMCPHCQKKFKTSVACRKHIKTHRNEIVAYSNPGVYANQKLDVENKNKNYTKVVPASQILLQQQQQVQDVQGLPVNSFTDDNFLNDLEGQHRTGNTSLPSIQSLQTSAQTANSVAQIPVLTGSVSLPSQSLQNANGNVHIQQIQDQNAYVTLQYMMEGLDQQINQSLFDPSKYSLGADSLSLPNSGQYTISTEHLEPASTVIETQIESTSTQNYDFYDVNLQPQPPTPVVTSAPQSKPADSKPIQIQSLHDLLDSQAAAAEAESKKEVEKIRESSRPISVKIYNELRAQEQKSRQERAAEANIPPGKLNQCQFCDRAFKKRSDLQRHLRIHTGEKPFKCHICSKTFRVKSTREVHMRVHTGGKSVSCHVCNNLFATKSSLRVHMRLHTNSKPYKCPHPNCERWFRTSGHRKAHIQSHFKAPRKQKVVSTLTGTKTTNSASTVRASRVQSQSAKPTSSSKSTALTTSTNVVVTSAPQVLPSVQVLQGKPTLPTLELSTQSQPTDLGSMPTVMAPMADQTHLSQNTTDPNSAPLQVLNNIQLAIDGPTIQITGLDLTSLQLDDNFLQNVTIFIPPMNPAQVPDMLGNAGNAANNILFMPTGSGAGTVQDLNSVELTKEEFNSILSASQQSTPTFSLLNDLNLGLIPSMQNVQLTQPTNTGTSDLDLDVNSMCQYVINNNAMMSSTAVSSSKESKQQASSGKKVLKSQSHSTRPSSSDNRTCGHCSKVFGKPSLLARHARVHTGEKPFRCKICRKAFSQKSSLIAHAYVHSNEKPFPCPSCSFRTVQRAALKKHFSKAHPSQQLPKTLAAQVQEQQQSNQATTKSREILGM